RLSLVNLSLHVHEVFAVTGLSTVMDVRPLPPIRAPEREADRVSGPMPLASFPGSRSRVPEFPAAPIETSCRPATCLVPRATWQRGVSAPDERRWMGSRDLCGDGFPPCRTARPRQ